MFAKVVSVSVADDKTWEIYSIYRISCSIYVEIFQFNILCFIM